MSDGKVKPWPKKPLCGASWTREDYERARADAWESRCRVAVDVLQAIAGIGGKHRLYVKGAQDALRKIGRLPPTLPEETKGE